MRIIQVINSLATGGAETLVVNLSAELSSLGNDVTIATLGSARGVPYAAAEHGGIRVLRLGNSLRDPRNLSRLRSLAISADVMHAHLFPTFYAAAFAQVRTRLVYTEHSTNNRRRSMRSARPIERAAYRRYDQLIGISDGVTDGLRSYLRSMGLAPDVRTIPNGIGDEYFEAVAGARSRASRPIKLIAIGTLDDRKNFALAVDALASLPDAELTIVGAGPLESRLRDQIAQKRLTERVRLLGRRSDIPALLDEHDALLSTSRFEGFGLVAAEAMARGLPVVGPNVPGLRDVVADGESGVLYDPQGATGRTVAAAVGQLTDEALYHALSRGAIGRSRSFTMRRAAAAHLSVYSAVGT